MTILQALAYFFGQALEEMRRGWKVSLLAVLVTAASLFLGGLFALLGANLAATFEGWQSQTRVVVTMEPGASVDDLSAVESVLDQPFVVAVVRVTPEEARLRLKERIPDLEEALDELGQMSLPESFEVQLTDDAAFDSEIEAWLGAVRSRAGVAGVDDDRVWVRQLLLAAGVLRGAAAVIGGLLLAGSIFIITSVVRLAALVHREEIHVLRLVGATEFFVKGPFVVQGLLQGLVGALVALGALFGAYVFLDGAELPPLLKTTLLGQFLPAPWQFLMLLLGLGAGTAGGLLSLRRTAGGLW